MTRDTSPAELRRGPEELGSTQPAKGRKFLVEDPLDIAQANAGPIDCFPEGLDAGSREERVLLGVGYIGTH